MGKNRWKWIGTLICSVVVLAIAAPQLYGATDVTSAGDRQAPVVPPPPTGGPALVRVYYGENRDLYSGVLISFNVLETDYDRGYHVVEATPLDLERFEKAGVRVEAETARTLDQYFQPRAALLDQTSAIPGYPCYRTVEETFSTAQSIVDNHPNLATWSDQGDSWEKTAALGGYDLMVLVLTNSEIPGPKPKLFATSALHAREYATAELVTRFAEYLVNNYGTDADATWLIDHHEIHLMLHANPDGRKQAETGLSWRKNTNQNYCGATSNYRGADLNRNFEFKWACCGGASDDECNILYRGPEAASEPETQAVQGYLREQFPDQRGPLDTDPAPDDATGVYLDIHAYGKLVLWPWGSTPDPAPNSTQLQTLGRKFAYWNDHSPEQAIGLYPTDGTTDGFSYGELGLASYCFELGTRFFQSCSYFENTIVPDNMPSLIYAAKVARTPYMTPAGPDAVGLSLSDGATAPGVPAGTPVTLQATINDTRYNNSNGTEPTQSVAAAEYYLDDPPWVTGATAHAMAASDGTYDATIEGVEATIDTAGLSEGQHIVFMRGQDAAGNWGAFSAVFLNVTVDNPPDLTVHVGDLDGSSAPAPRSRWEATVTITVHDSDEGAVSGAFVEGDWSDGATGGASCTTDASGQCSVVKGNLKSNVPSATFSVSNVTSDVGDYAPGDNHDPDGDSDGTSITVDQPVDNTPPTVSITAPDDGATFTSEALIDFSGTASDAEDGDLTADLVWTSSIDGQIDTGGGFSAQLSDGVHTITAEVTDSGGAGGSDTIGITVGSPPTVHVGDLDGVGATVRSKWEATVTIAVHDQDHAPLADAVVAGTWSAGATGGAECTTDANGQCDVVKGNLKTSVGSVTFTVDNVTLAGYSYTPGSNHEPDGDSDGTIITVTAP